MYVSCHPVSQAPERRHILIELSWVGFEAGEVARCPPPPSNAQRPGYITSEGWGTYHLPYDRPLHWAGCVPARQLNRRGCVRAHPSGQSQTVSGAVDQRPPWKHSRLFVCRGLNRNSLLHVLNGALERGKRGLATMGERADRGLLVATPRRATATASEFFPQGGSNVLWALAMGNKAGWGLREAMQGREGRVPHKGWTMPTWRYDPRSTELRLVTRSGRAQYKRLDTPVLI